MSEAKPVLYVIGCGGRPAAQLPGFTRHAAATGWDPCAILTPDAVKFTSPADLEAATGRPVRTAYKRPEDPDILPPADAFAVTPATFNTVNKLAAGISDNLATGLLNEGIGLARPVLVVPWPSIQLYRHPAFSRSIALLREWGVTVLLDPERLPQATPEPAVFPWAQARDALAGLRARARRQDG